MVHICAWCERFLGLKTPEPKVQLTHGICNPCLERQAWQDDDGAPVLVVSRRRAHLLPMITELLRGSPNIRVVVDRRQTERRLDDVDPPRRNRRKVERRGEPDFVLR